MFPLKLDRCPVKVSVLFDVLCDVLVSSKSAHVSCQDDANMYVWLWVKTNDQFWKVGNLRFLFMKAGSHTRAMSQLAGPSLLHPQPRSRWRRTSAVAAVAAAVAVVVVVAAWAACAPCAPCAACGEGGARR